MDIQMAAPESHESNKTEVVVGGEASSHGVSAWSLCDLTGREKLAPGRLLCEQGVPSVPTSM